MVRFIFSSSFFKNFVSSKYRLCVSIPDIFFFFNIIIYIYSDAPLLNATTAGQIWAVDVGVDMTKKKKVAWVSVGSWATQDGSTPAQVSTYTAAAIL